MTVGEILGGEGENALYGQEYSYTIQDKYGKEVSSGVASYEPMVGNDENPFRQPVPYTVQESKGHIPAIEAFQERPFGETFFPSASVGYSKVTVKNIHRNKGKTSKAITEHEFYTAKNFPVRVDETFIQKHDRPAPKSKMTFPFKNTKSESMFAASQGYSIVLNDMHGKPLSTKNYMLEEIDNSGNISVIKKLIGGEKYNYRHEKGQRGNELRNTVEVLTPDGEIKEQLLGVEVDLAIENRRTYEKSKSLATNVNLDVFPIPSPIGTNSNIYS